MNGMTRWDDMHRRGVLPVDAAIEMRCSRRTAVAELRAAGRRETDHAFRYRHAEKVARLEALPAGDQSTWPTALQHLAQRIVLLGPASVTDRERAAVVAALPRGITIRR